MNARITTLAASTLALLAACGTTELPTGTEPAEPIDPLVTVLTQSCSAGNSLQPRYRAKNGTLLQGLTGPSFTVQSARMGCERIDDLALDKATLVGNVGGTLVTGGTLTGAVLTVADRQGSSEQIAIAKVAIDLQDPSGETLFYTLVALDANKSVTRNLCVPDAEGRSAAIALSGRWDETGAHLEDGSISFHCTSGAIAKCAQFGYRPWQTFKGQSLVAHHQACTRLLRGDYCGDGVAQTKDGTDIDLYDNLPMRTLEPALLMTFEASWMKQGAYCIARERWLNITSLLTPTCRGQFSLSLQPSPILPLDLCFAVRTDARPTDALLSNRTSLNLGL